MRCLDLTTVVPRIAQEDVWNKSVARVSLDFSQLVWWAVEEQDLEVHVYEALYGLVSNAASHLDLTLHENMAVFELATIRAPSVDLCRAILLRTYWLSLNPLVQDVNLHELQCVRTLVVVPCMRNLRIWDMPMLSSLALQPGNHVLRELTLHGLRWVQLDDVLRQLVCCPQLEYFASSNLGGYTPQRLWLEHPNIRTLKLASTSTNWLYLHLPLLREARLDLPTPVGYTFTGNLHRCAELSTLDLHCHCTCADLASDTFLPPHLSQLSLKNDRLEAVHLQDWSTLETLHLETPAASAVTLERLARLRSVVLHGRGGQALAASANVTECPLVSFRSVSSPLFYSV